MFKKMFSSLLGQKAPVAAPWFLEQRRKSTRRGCEFEVECWSGRVGFEATVVDLSAGGLRLKFSSSPVVKLGSNIRVAYTDENGEPGQTIEGTCRFHLSSDKDNTRYIGLEFKDPKALGKSWVKTRMQEAGFRPYNIREQRTTCRLESKFLAKLSLAGQEISCSLLNLGLDGAYLEMLKPLRAGVEVTFRVSDPRLSEIDFKGTVRHQQHPDPSSPFGHGLAFTGLSSEHKEVLKDLILSQLRPQWEIGFDSFEVNLGDNQEPEEEIEIPDLASIMAETEPEEEESEDTVGGTSDPEE